MVDIAPRSSPKDTMQGGIPPFECFLKQLKIGRSGAPVSVLSYKCFIYDPAGPVLSEFLSKK
jgi:hypothetical protein